MELKCIKEYTSAEVALYAGDTTIGIELSEEKKIQMLTDFPTRFVVIESTPAPEKQTLDLDTKVPLVETKEEDSQLKKAAREKKAK